MRSSGNKFVPSLDGRAHEDLRFIRSAMENASSFTSVPGWGGMLMGLTAVAAAAIAWQQTTTAAWLSVWVAEGALAFLIGVVAMVLKARASGLSLTSPPARRFALSFTPAIFAGALLTVTLWRDGGAARLPGVWLLLYGAAVLSGGAFSVAVVRLMGALLMLLGAVALFSPPGAGDLFMAGGFGVLEIVFGIIVARRHGG
jgi:hypothetical protein